jgi:hypothetical protein
VVEGFAEALAEVGTRPVVPELDRVCELAPLLCAEFDALEAVVRVGTTNVELRSMGEPVPALGATTTAVVFAGGFGGEVWIDRVAVKSSSDEL